MTRIFNPKTSLVFYSDHQKYTIDNLYMDFDINLTSLSNPNTAEITIYNLSESTRNLFEEQHQAIEFHAGYENPELIFIGTTKNVVNEKQGFEWKTILYCGDGYKEYFNKYFSKTYLSGTLVKTIMEDMCKETGLPYKIDDMFLTDKILMSESHSGRIKDCLNTLCADFDHEWTILHGVLEIRLKGNVFSPDPTAILLSSDTGMLGSPSLIVRTMENQKNDKVKNPEKTTDKRRVGVSVISVLNPSIKPGRLIKIKSTKSNSQVSLDNPMESKNLKTTIDRVYLVDSCFFYGNNYGGDFNVEVLADVPVESNEFYKAALKEFS